MKVTKIFLALALTLLFVIPASADDDEVIVRRRFERSGLLRHAKTTATAGRQLSRPNLAAAAH